MHKITYTIFSLLVLLVFSCSKESKTGADAASATGTGGSLARFTISSNHLYIADHSSLSVYDISNPATPVHRKTIQIGFGIETIYPYQDKLFIGSVTGMFIYSISNPSNPLKLGEALHARSCDPVVAEGNTAYVTLRGGSACGPARDGLYIYDISNVSTPVQTSLLEISTPFGLGKKDSIVYVCRGLNGLSMVSVKNTAQPRLMQTIRNEEFLDVIPFNNILICYVKDGLLLYDISNAAAPDRITKITY